MNKVTLENYLRDSLQDEIKQDWVFINASENSSDFGFRYQVSHSKYSDAVERFAMQGRFGKVNKVLLQIKNEAKLSFYLTGGMVKSGQLPVDLSAVRTYFNGKRVALEASLTDRPASQLAASDA